MSISALSHLASVKGVASAFIFNEKKQILAREVPDQYRTDGLIQIAGQVLQFLPILSNTTEIKLRYDNFGLWYRRFGPNLSYHLIAFTERDSDFSVLRQPVNLAILNLEKAVKQIEEDQAREVSQSALYQSAMEAERKIFVLSGEDTNKVFEKLSLLSEYFIGPLGPEILQQACHKLELNLPITNPNDMRAIIKTSAELTGNSHQSKVWMDQAEDVIQRV